MKNIPIGEVLKDYGYITQQQLDAALVYQSEHRSLRLGQALLELGYVTQRQVLEALSQRLQLKIVDVTQSRPDLDAARRIPQQLALKYSILPLYQKGNVLTVVTDDPLNYYGLEDIRQITGMELEVTLSETEPLKQAIQYCYAEVSARQAAEKANKSDIAVTPEALAIDVAAAAGEDSEAPVIRLLDTLLQRAVATNASDIHIEPFEGETVVRMRIDGAIVEYVRLQRALHQPLIARVKILSNLDIAEHRIPQDGHFRVRMEDGVNINIRVSILPTVFGEKAVLRVLGTTTLIAHAGHFGMDDETYARFLPILSRPNGIIYLTGPTGSGKTTTLYMVLQYLAQRPVNISTIEDPVERNLDRINQSQVNNIAGLTFEAGLRALLRQDPDILMVGETRDNETASISVRAAITGHMVLSTLHTNDALSSVVRLADMGVENYLIANSVVGLVAQRLVRRVCTNCAREMPVTEEESMFLGSIKTVRRGAGCPLCNGTGYSGRMAIHEIVSIDKTLRRMIAAGAPQEEMTAYARKAQGMRSLRESALSLVAQGVTTPEELLKITYYED